MHSKQSLGLKKDKGKLRYDLLPVKPVESVVRVLTQGAEKYSDWNWLSVPNAKERYYAATLRHILRWRQGFLKDKQTKQSHLSHAICSLLFLLHFEQTSHRRKS
jgi:hypothetical protein